MIRTQILLEPEQHQTLTELAHQQNRSLSDLVREMLDAQITEQRQAALKKAAQALLDDYQNDSDLKAFQSLAGDDFHA
jgi:predicted DNA-binding protein